MLIAAIIFLTAAVDAFTKVLALENLTPGASSPFINGFIQFTLTTNTGGAFGIGKGHGHLMTFVAAAIFLVILCWLIKREKSEDKPPMIELTGLSFVLGGALGNLFDRVTRGEVTDFLEFVFMQFPVFNFADAMIDVGAVLVIISAWRRPAARASAQAEPERQDQGSGDSEDMESDQHGRG